MQNLPHAGQLDADSNTSLRKALLELGNSAPERVDLFIRERAKKWLKSQHI
jgi:hypothetical protein